MEIEGLRKIDKIIRPPFGKKFCHAHPRKGNGYSVVENDWFSENNAVISVCSCGYTVRAVHEETRER